MPSSFTRLALVWALIIATFWIGDRIVRDILLVQSEPRPITPRGSLTQTEAHAIEIFERLAPSVVYIVTESDRMQALGFGSTRQGAGSGFIWDLSGHVVTNLHVVTHADRLAVRVDDGETVSARLVGTAPDYDLAVLKLSAPRTILQPIPIGASADLKVGQSVFAIGNPFGLDRTLTTGVISALDRRLPTASNREIRGVIQTDAAINPGNSGGPLLDSAGRLIGVNTAILSETGTYAGIGFAVPVDVVNRVVPQLITRGRAERPGIGIVVLPEETTARLGITGVVIEQVLPNSAAARANLRGIDPRTGELGDIITRVQGQPVRTVADLVAILQQIGVGQEVEIEVYRKGRGRTIRLQTMDISS